MNRAKIDMKLVLVRVRRNTKMNSLAEEMDGHAPNTNMVYTEENRTKQIEYIGSSEPSSRIPRSVKSASPTCAVVDAGSTSVNADSGAGRERMAG